MPELQGRAERAKGRFGIVAARFNAFVVDQMIEGALDALKRHGVADNQVILVRVPGAFELPQATRAMVRTGRYAGIIALGAVIRGDTAHFDFVAGEASRGLNRVALDSGCPVAFGLLTTDTVEQALARASVDQGNKGFEAALVALEMADLFEQISDQADG